MGLVVIGTEGAVPVDWGSVRLARRATAICAVAFACLVSPAFAAADDPLLSGYSGPGGGEQVVIGSDVIPPKNGTGSIRQSATGQPPVQQQASNPNPNSSSGDAGSAGNDDRSPGESSDRTEQRSNVAAAAAKPTYPNRVSSASGLPLSREDMILIAGAALAASLVALTLVRLRGSVA